MELKPILKPRILHYFEDGKGHGFDHTERVYNLAVRIAQEERADIEIVQAAALLHDICRKKEELTGQCHAEEGAKLASQILGTINFSKHKISAVIHCIKVHRYSKQLAPETIEAKILQDADRLDALGAIIIARVMMHSVLKGRPVYDPEILPDKIYTSKGKTAINHFYEKILKLKPETFHTKLAQQIALGRYKFTQEYVDRFIAEWNGEK